MEIIQKKNWIAEEDCKIQEMYSMVIYFYEQNKADEFYEVSYWMLIINLKEISWFFSDWQRWNLVLDVFEGSSLHWYRLRLIN